MGSVNLKDSFNAQNKILVADDVPSARKVMQRLLKILGVEAIELAPNGKAAFEIAKQGGIGLIISDWEMPEMDGIAFLKAVRQETATKEIPFIMITSTSDRANVVAALQGGVTDYVVKPFTAALLSEKICKVLGLESESEEA